MSTVPDNPAAGRPASPVSRQDVEAILPLLPMQQAMLVRHKADPKDDPGLLQVTAKLHGPLDPNTLKQAWAYVAQEQPALRMSIPPREEGDPLAVVWREAKAPWSVVDAGTEHALAQHKQAEKQAFDSIERKPGYRITIARQGPVDHTLIWTCHHALIDGWSASTVLEGLFATYDRLARSVPLPPPASRIKPLRAYHAWLRAQDQEKVQAFWTESLAGVAGCPPVQVGEIDQGRSGTAVIDHRFAGALGARATDLAAALKTTPGILIQCAWAAVLGAVLDRGEAVFGTAVASRSAPIAGLDQVAGCFANLVPVRLPLQPEARVVDWIHRATDFQHQRQPFEHADPAEVQAQSGVPGHIPLFDSFLVVENFPSPNADQPAEHGVSVQAYESGLTSAFPLTVAVLLSEPWRVRCQYDRARLSDEAAHYIVKRFEQALDLITSQPEHAIGEILRALQAADGKPVVHKIDSASTTPGGYVSPSGPIEIQLQGVWERVLGRSRIGVHDNYFQLGGTSLMGVRLFSEIEATFGQRLPVSALMASPTISQLAKRLGAGDADPTPDWACLVPIRTTGERTPVFCVHAGGAEVLFYRDLANRLGPNQPVYGLQPVGLDGKTAPLNAIPRMAAKYIRELRKAQPQGPYRLLGYCIGATVCLEMARQLEAIGERVDLMVVIDSGLHAAHDMKQLTPVQRIRAARQEGRVIDAVLRPIHARIGVAYEALRHLTGSSHQRREITRQRVQRACQHAFRTYKPQPCRAPILLLRSTEFAEMQEKMRHMDWAGFTPSLEVEVIESGHETILSEPVVVRVAGLISDRIDQLESIADARG